GQGSDLPANPAFFSRPEGLGPGRGAAASTRNPAGAAIVAGCHPTAAALWRSPGCPEARTESSSRADNSGPGGKRSGEPPAGAARLRPARGDVPVPARPGASPGYGLGYTC